MTNTKTYIEEYNQDFFHAISEIDVTFIETLKNEINQARLQDRKIFMLGNGGSAASSSHWVADFSKNITVEQDKRLHIQSLVDNSPLVTALSNDVAYEEVFTEQLKNYLKPKDLVIGLSVSGNSPNLVSAFKYAKDNDATVFSILGDYNGEMKTYSDYCEVIQSKNYGVVEDAHMYFCHVISQLLKNDSEEKFA
ncbi:SIS domain-containing protein [Candidatus Enterococcus ferrettii]|uniref:D-sedoheptulose 7-phosphate isomerase n=1 Tax=Candidatus Enterococcus ferrettii TaxID=2815324 RepID=A0ABV0ERU0_9ENTE|nr:SIS domain-containing protein [Enterococcus sp. 665A]MBO1341214.1 SIS domain-containing protein [Enterococcus sp. 665A]